MSEGGKVSGWKLSSTEKHNRFSDAHKFDKT